MQKYLSVTISRLNHWTTLVILGLDISILQIIFEIFYCDIDIHVGVAAYKREVVNKAFPYHYISVLANPLNFDCFSFHHFSASTSYSVMLYNLAQ